MSFRTGYQNVHAGQSGDLVEVLNNPSDLHRRFLAGYDPTLTEIRGGRCAILVFKDGRICGAAVDKGSCIDSQHRVLRRRC